MRTLEIKKNDANQRLDKFLQKRFKTLPKSLMYKYIRKKCIKVNGKKCDIQTMLKEGDVLTFYIKDEFFEASFYLLYPATWFRIFTGRSFGPFSTYS